MVVDTNYAKIPADPLDPVNLHVNSVIRQISL